MVFLKIFSWFSFDFLSIFLVFLQFFIWFRLDFLFWLKNFLNLNIRSAIKIPTNFFILFYQLKVPWYIIDKNFNWVNNFFKLGNLFKLEKLENIKKIIIKVKGDFDASEMITVLLEKKIWKHEKHFTQQQIISHINFIHEVVVADSIVSDSINTSNWFQIF